VYGHCRPSALDDGGESESGCSSRTESVPQTEAIMRTKLTSIASKIIPWLRETWAEMDYAQRRMIELRTGVPLLRMPPAHTEIDQLEAIYALPSREPDQDSE
jgi:hypothetical protein